MKIAPFGTWSSPITADLILKDTVFGGAPHLEIDGDEAYWEEARHAEAGRTTVVRTNVQGTIEECTPAPFDVRSRVHSYGGGAFTVNEGTVYFSNKVDVRIYAASLGSAPKPITPAEAFRYADLVLDRSNHRLLAVREDHRTAGAEPPASIVAIALNEPYEVRVLAEGHDFFAAPTPSSDGQKIAYIAWDHPNMPWDETSLFVLDGETATTIASGASIAEPRWARDGSLHYVDDRTGHWNLYRARPGVAPERYGPSAAEFTRPHWLFGTSCYGFLDNGIVVAAYVTEGVWRLAQIDPTTGESIDIEQPYGEVFRVKTSGTSAYAVVGGADRPRAIIKITDGRIEVLREEIALKIDPGDLSTPTSIAFERDGVRAFVDFYPPRNSTHSAPSEERPPLIVLGHGGPTSSAGKQLDLGGVQFWTSRGFGVAKVDYRGSTGYGTAYRRALDGGWGEFDVADCVNAARHLSEADLVDEKRMAIVGGSAGGLTVLAALAFFDVFRAGVSHYGISDLELLAEETHKFESRYVDRLIAPFATNRELYKRRSPIHHVDQITSPVLFFQGDEDTVVPPNQAALMVEKLREHGVGAEYVLFEGEGHGFRRADTRRSVLEAQLDFFHRLFTV